MKKAKEECTNYKPWDEVEDSMVKTKECVWLGPYNPTTRQENICECPMSRHHRQRCPWASGSFRS
jgi:hypothetical protein